MKLLVAFSSPKRSAKTVAMAAKHAKALDAEVYLVRVLPDAEKVGVIAQLIESEQPHDKAQNQLDRIIADLESSGLKAYGQIRKGEIGPTLVGAVSDLNIDMVFLGTMPMPYRRSRFSLAPNDPVVHYMVDHCPVALVLVRPDQAEIESEEV